MFPGPIEDEVYETNERADDEIEFGNLPRVILEDLPMKVKNGMFSGKLHMKPSTQNGDDPPHDAWSNCTLTVHADIGDTENYTLQIKDNSVSRKLDLEEVTLTPSTNNTFHLHLTDDSELTFWTPSHKTSQDWIDTLGELIATATERDKVLQTLTNEQTIETLEAGVDSMFSADKRHSSSTQLIYITEQRQVKAAENINKITNLIGLVSSSTSSPAGNGMGGMGGHGICGATSDNNTTADKGMSNVVTVKQPQQLITITEEEGEEEGNGNENESDNLADTDGRRGNGHSTQTTEGDAQKHTQKRTQKHSKSQQNMGSSDGNTTTDHKKSLGLMLDAALGNGITNGTADASHATNGTADYGADSVAAADTDKTESDSGSINSRKIPLIHLVVNLIAAMLSLYLYAFQYALLLWYKAYIVFPLTTLLIWLRGLMKVVHFTVGIVVRVLELCALVSVKVSDWLDGLREKLNEVAVSAHSMLD